MNQSNGLQRYDQIIKDKYGENAFLVDVNRAQGQDAVMDKGDQIVYQENGVQKMKALGEEMYDVKYRTSVVENSNAMNDRMHDGSVGFSGNMENQKFNNQYWEQTHLDGKQYWKVKDGVKASDAVSDIFKKQNGQKYDMDCAASINMVLLKSKLDTIGAEDFDKQYDNMTVRGWSTWNGQPGGGNASWDVNGGLDHVSGDRNNLNGSVDNLQIGDYAYFTNPNVPQGAGAAQGENAIYMGQDQAGNPMFFGNPIGIIHDDQCSFGQLSTIHGAVSQNGLVAADINQEQGYGA